MKRFFGSIFVLIMWSLIGYLPAHAEAGVANSGVEEKGMEYLLFEDIPSVITASKQEQPLTKAPAVMTVVTAEDIARMGARSLEDVLKRTMGFFPTTSVDWNIITSRGIGADMNHLYLFLIDGHSINSVNGWGPMNQHILPLLSDVARIEIIRGPGSTLWGSDAVMGTINFITKDGAAIKGIQTSVEYSTTEKAGSVNVLLGNEAGKNISYTGSLTYFAGEGWRGNNDKKTWHHNYQYFPSGGGTNPTTDMGNWQEADPSWEFYGKAKIQDFTFMARHLHYLFQEPQRSRPTLATKREFFLDTNFVETSYLKEIDETMSFETKIFGDFTTKGRNPYAGSVAESKYIEDGGGLDAVLRKTFADKHHLQFGVRGDIVKIGPNVQTTYNADTGVLVSATTTNYLLTKTGVDKTYGIYLEDQSDITDSLSLIGGIRLNDSKFRDKGQRFIPRGGVIYTINNNWTVKYMYNSGTYLPSVTHSKRMPVTAADTIREANNSLGSVSNDFQAMYNDEKTTASIDVFHMSLNNFISLNPVASGTIEAGYMNLGEFVTNGIEAEVRRKLMEKLSIYGNYSYARATLVSAPDNFRNTILLNTWVDGNNHMLNLPRHIYNLGVDWACLPNCNWNFHMRGWGMAKIVNTEKTSNTTFRWQFGHQYFDSTFLVESLCGKPLSFSVTCRNIFNSRGIEPYAPANPSWYYEEGRSFDLRLTYTF